MTAEEWSPIPGFDGYEVSNLGRVLSRRRKKAVILTPGIAPNGYERVGLWNNTGKATTVSVHRLVASAFVSGQEPGLVVCHNDSDKRNNRADNLRWDTIQANAWDASRLGANPRQVLNEGQVREIRELYKTGKHTHRSLSSLFGVTHQAIRDLLIGKNYRWVI